MGYVVTASAIALKDTAGRIGYYYENSPVPEWVPQERIDELAVDGLIGSDDPNGEGVPDPVVTQPQAPAVVKPGGRDSREKWAEYARAQGAGDDEVKPVDEGGLTRDQLREKYGN